MTRIAKKTGRPELAVAVIATGPYSRFLPDLVSSCEKYLVPELQKSYFVFTDSAIRPDSSGGKLVVKQIQHKPWPYVTLTRFHTILSQTHLLKRHQRFLYLDADMIVVDVIRSNDLFDRQRPLTAVRHPNIKPWGGTFERDSKSTACIQGEHKEYFQGCLWGGEMNQVIKMIQVLKERVDTDFSNDVVAVWHDESHLNKYLLEEGVPVHILEPTYACPQRNKRLLRGAKIIHIHKDEQLFPTFPGTAKIDL